VTRDVDAVVDAPDDPASAELLLRRTVGAGGDEHFALAHRFGFESASTMRLVVENGPDVLAEVAEPAGLVATKLHAAQWRRDR